MPDHATPGGHEPAALPLGERRARLTARLAEIGLDAAALSSADIGALGLIEELLDKVPRAQPGATEVAAAVSARWKDLVRRAVRLGIADDLVDRVQTAADADVLTLLERLVPNAEMFPVDTAASVEAYRTALERIGTEYVGTLSRRTLSTLDISAETLVEDAEVLADTARMVRSVPVVRRDALWPAMVVELNAAAPSYGRIASALVDTGIAEALEAEQRLALRHLHVELVSPAHREVLRAAGEPDPDAALAALVRAAHRAGEAAGRQETISQLLQEGARAFPQPPGAPPPKRKWWTGFGKLLTGAGLAGLDVAGGVGMGAAAGPLAPLAVGVTWSVVLGSCAAGTGAIVEAVGAFRGE